MSPGVYHPRVGFCMNNTSISPIMDAWFKEASQNIDKGKVRTPTALRYRHVVPVDVDPNSGGSCSASTSSRLLAASESK